MFRSRLSNTDRSLPSSTYLDAAYAYDASVLLLKTLDQITNGNNSNDVISAFDRQMHFHSRSGVTVSRVGYFLDTIV